MLRRIFLPTLLLIAAQCFWVGAVDLNDLKVQLDRMETDQFMQKLILKNLINRVLETNAKTSDRLQKLEISRNATQPCNTKELEENILKLTGNLQKLDESQKDTKTFLNIMSNEFRGKIGDISDYFEEMRQYQNETNGHIKNINTRMGKFSVDVEKVDQKLDMVHSLAKSLSESQQKNTGQIEEINIKAISITSKIEVVDRRLDDVRARTIKLENMLESVLTQVQDVQNAIHQLAKYQYFTESSDFDKRNALSVAGKQFYFNTSNVTRTIARDWCSDRGMEMATLKTLTEMEAVTKEFKRRGWTSGGFWVSASDIGRTPGDFRWPDGSAVDSGTWYKEEDQPDEFGAGKQTCVFLSTYYIKFWDAICSRTSDTLCQMPAAISSRS